MKEIKFDSDFAVFGTVAGNLRIKTGTEFPISDSKIEYTNASFNNLYGDYKGVSLLNFLIDVCGNPAKGMKALATLIEKGILMTEGSLNERFIKCHARVVDKSVIETEKEFFQIAITDISEISVVRKLYENTSQALVRAAEAADEDTGDHIERINYYSEHLSVLAGVDEILVDKISRFAQLHDIGKIKVADIIQVPRVLDDREFALMKNHTIYGADILEGMEGMEVGYNIALEHHERFDGTGYPHGKKGDEITLEARIVSIVDVFDALVSKRPYKPSFDYKKTFDIMINGDGRVHPEHFDPELLELFTHNYDHFVMIHEQWKD